jgi:hypothetical protein
MTGEIGGPDGTVMNVEYKTGGGVGEVWTTMGCRVGGVGLVVVVALLVVWVARRVVVRVVVDVLVDALAVLEVSRTSLG